MVRLALGGSALGMGPGHPIQSKIFVRLAPIDSGSFSGSAAKAGRDDRCQDNTAQNRVQYSRDDDKKCRKKNTNILMKNLSLIWSVVHRLQKKKAPSLNNAVYYNNTKPRQYGENRHCYPRTYQDCQLEKEDKVQENAESQYRNQTQICSDRLGFEKYVQQSKIEHKSQYIDGGKALLDKTIGPEHLAPQKYHQTGKLQ